MYPPGRHPAGSWRDLRCRGHSILSGVENDNDFASDPRRNAERAQAVREVSGIVSEFSGPNASNGASGVA